MSCKESHCVHELAIQGSNKQNEWFDICYISKPINYFKGQTTNADYPSTASYSQIRLTHNSTNDSGFTYFPIHVLELYGFLINSINNSCKHIKFNYHSTTLIFIFLINKC